jgi:hypothetical protein
MPSNANALRKRRGYAERPKKDLSLKKGDSEKNKSG